MEFIDKYLQKNNFIPVIQTEPDNNLGMCIVIPCYNEPDLLTTLDSLWQCSRPQCSVEVIIVINQPETVLPEISLRNHQTLKEANNWLLNHTDEKLKFFPVFRGSLPSKHAGVGLARKLGMDESVFRFGKLNKPDGIIVGFDADSLCDTNYLIEIENHFIKNNKTPGASIYFEHPVLTGTNDKNTGIILYELHLRYLNQCFRYMGHPHAFQTIGSSFAVRASAYVKQGGMNQRQAGEDFYFLQKIISLGNYTEINTTRVIPSARESDRVPFGTGAAIKEWTNKADKTYYTYNLAAFEGLKLLFSNIEALYTAEPPNFNAVISVLPEALIQYLGEINYSLEIQRLKQNTNSLNSFTNQFYNWFSLFKAIKFLNSSHLNYYNYRDVLEMAKSMLKELQLDSFEAATDIELLTIYRGIERGNANQCC